MVAILDRKTFDAIQEALSAEFRKGSGSRPGAIDKEVRVDFDNGDFTMVPADLLRDFGTGPFRLAPR